MFHRGHPQVIDWQWSRQSCTNQSTLSHQIGQSLAILRQSSTNPVPIHTDISQRPEGTSTIQTDYSQHSMITQLSNGHLPKPLSPQHFVNRLPIHSQSPAQLPLGQSSVNPMSILCQSEDNPVVERGTSALYGQTTSFNGG